MQLHYLEGFMINSLGLLMQIVAIRCNFLATLARQRVGTCTRDLFSSQLSQLVLASSVDGERN